MTIQLEHVSFRYRNQWILDNVDFVVREREFVALVGPNGGGKSTLVKAILGLVSPQKGQISVFGKTPLKSRKNIGYVPQFIHFNREFPASVFDVVSFAMIGNFPTFSKTKKQQQNDAIHKALEQTELTDLKHAQINELSGGQVQRVLLARAIANSPKALILDEPTANIDMHIEKNVFDLLKVLAEKMAIIVVSHDVGFISDYVSRVACLNNKLHWHTPQSVDGNVIQSLYDQPVNMVQHYHGHAHD